MLMMSLVAELFFFVELGSKSYMTLLVPRLSPMHHWNLFVSGYLEECKIHFSRLMFFQSSQKFLRINGCREYFSAMITKEISLCGIQPRSAGLESGWSSIELAGPGLKYICMESFISTCK